MRNIGKSIRGGVLAIVLSFAMVISVFAGTGMEVRAEGGYTYQSYILSLNQATKSQLYAQCKDDVFAYSEKSDIETWLQTLSASDLFSTAVFIVYIDEGNTKELYAYLKSKSSTLVRLDGTGNIGADDISSSVYIVKDPASLTAPPTLLPLPPTVHPQPLMPTLIHG